MRPVIKEAEIASDLDMDSSKLRRCEHQVGGHMTKGLFMRKPAESGQDGRSCMLGFVNVSPCFRLHR